LLIFDEILQALLLGMFAPVFAKGQFEYVVKGPQHIKQYHFYILI